VSDSGETEESVIRDELAEPEPVPTERLDASPLSDRRSGTPSPDVGCPGTDDTEGLEVEDR